MFPVIAGCFGFSVDLSGGDRSPFWVASVLVHFFYTSCPAPNLPFLISLELNFIVNKKNLDLVFFF